MDMTTYQYAARESSIDTRTVGDIAVLGLGVAGESGEVVEHIKKMIRDDDGKMSLSRREMIKEELGDLLWYLSQVALAYNLDLTEVAEFNIEKLRTRREGRGLGKDPLTLPSPSAYPYEREPLP